MFHSSFVSFAAFVTIVTAPIAAAANDPSFAIVSDTCTDSRVMMNGAELQFDGTPATGDLGIEISTNSAKSAITTVRFRAVIPGHELSPENYLHAVLFDATNLQVAKVERTEGFVSNYKFVLAPRQRVATTTEGFTEFEEITSFTISFEVSSTLYINIERKLLSGAVDNTLVGYQGCADGVKNLSLLKALSKK
jgi:hypothetical protein